MSIHTVTLPIPDSGAFRALFGDPVCRCGHGRTAHDADADADAAFACAACASITKHGDGCPVGASCREMHLPRRAPCRVFHF